MAETTTDQTKVLDAELNAAGERAGERAAELINKHLDDPRWQRNVSEEIAKAAGRQASATINVTAVLLSLGLGAGFGYWLAKRKYG
jgi:hypothetical protein